jgi:hypothetical protein
MTEPGPDDIRRMYPGWMVYRGTDQRWRARPESAGPPVEPVVGEGLQDLADEIRLHLAKT